MIPTILMLFVAAPPDFDTGVIPVLTRAGCNAGACHGAAAGRGGFHLSLFGGDPAADYDAVVRELEGRRVNLAHPETSLILGKPTGELRHEGGIRLEADGPGAKMLAGWIAAGAPRGKARRLTDFDVSPADRVVESAGTAVTLRATARFDCGPAEDVTAWTVFSTTDPAAVELDSETATATVRRPGRHVVVARYLDRVVPVRFAMPLSETAVDHSKERRANFIDDEVYRTLTELRIPVSPPADDATFLRRVRLDLTGRLPTPEEAEAYLADRSADKRTAAVDRLLRTDEFADYWAYRFAALFRVRALPNEKEGAAALHGWLREQLRDGTPFDAVAQQLITAVGDSHMIPPAYFARLSPDARAQAELIGEAFLGVRLRCANCHNHPLDRWTQDDYHGLAAAFARLDRGRVVKVVGRGAVTNPRTGEPAVPRIPGVHDLDPAADGREAFAGWLTAEGNPYFARATVNRLWRAMFGRGLVEPADDLRDTSPATHPELLARLADDYASHHYDVRRTLRLIATSETYGRSGTVLPGNRADDHYYSHSYRRPLAAEVMADAFADVTGVSDRYGDEPAGTRAVVLTDPRTPAPALDVLGRCSREVSCEGAAAGGGLSAKLHQINGDLVNRKLALSDGRLHKLIAAGWSDDEIITEFTLRALGRRPTAAETALWRGQRTGDRTAWLEDVAWGLLSSAEFRTNH